MINIMLDIETMGLKKDSAIIQIAAVIFKDNFDVVGKFNKFIRLGDDNNIVYHDTLAWWLTQEASYDIGMRMMKTQLDLKTVLIDLNKFIYSSVGHNSDEFSLLRMWAKNAIFDFKLLNNAYRRCGLSPLWEDIYCAMKTFKHFTRSGKGPSIPRDGLAHDAISDCLHQINQLKKVSGSYISENIAQISKMKIF